MLCNSGSEAGNMKWVSLLSMFFCSANFVVAAVALALCVVDLSLNWSVYDRYPLDVTAEWRDYLTQFIPVTIFLITSAVLSAWGVTRPRKPCTALVVLALHITGLTICIKYHNNITALVPKIPESSSAIFNRTAAIFRIYEQKNGQVHKWLPKWLDDIQRNRRCCGVESFKDWDQFWRQRNKVPDSCCTTKAPCSMITAKDDPDLMPMMNVYGTGCSEVIIEAAGRQIFETTVILVTLVVLLSLSFVVFAIQYTMDFVVVRINRQELVLENEAVASLSIGETWARMGFRRKDKTLKIPSSRYKNDNASDFNFDASVPGSYSDVYLKKLQHDQKSKLLSSEHFRSGDGDDVNDSNSPNIIPVDSEDKRRSIQLPNVIKAQRQI